MPRYYFDLYDCISVHDELGLDLPDLDAVRTEAHRALAELAANHPADSGSVQICTEVRDGTGIRPQRDAADPVEAAHPGHERPLTRWSGHRSA